jgi:hypothetical protein
VESLPLIDSKVLKQIEKVGKINRERRERKAATSEL